MTIYFSMLMHIYQPPIQLPFVVRQIAEECYSPLIKIFKNHPDSKLTLNCNAVLTEQLHDYGLSGIINGFADLGENGQLEFTNSAKFHALLPLIPPPEIKRQIELNTSTNRHFFGKSFNPRGFFPPEMAIDEITFNPIKETGHEYFLMSGVGNPNPIFPTTTFFHTNNGLKVVFRDDSISNDMSFDRLDAMGLINRLKYNEHIGRDYYIVLAQDGETYGHHIQHLFNKLLNPLLDYLQHNHNLKLVTLSELIDRFQSDTEIKPKPSSWSTSGEDLQWQNPLSLWYDPDNPVHILQHKIIMKTTSMVVSAENYQKNASDHEKHLWGVARSYLDRGVHSCQQWWASKKPWYSPDMIIKGLHELVLSAVNAKRSIPQKYPSVVKTFSDALHEILDLETDLIEQLN